MDSSSSRSDSVTRDFETLLIDKMNREASRPRTPDTLRVPQAAPSMVPSPDTSTRTVFPSNPQADGSPGSSTQGTRRVTITLRVSTLSSDTINHC